MNISLRGKKLCFPPRKKTFTRPLSKKSFLFSPLVRVINALSLFSMDPYPREKKSSDGSWTEPQKSVPFRSGLPFKRRPQKGETRNIRIESRDGRALWQTFFTFYYTTFSPFHVRLCGKMLTHSQIRKKIEKTGLFFSQSENGLMALLIRGRTGRESKKTEREMLLSTLCVTGFA